MSTLRELRERFALLQGKEISFAVEALQENEETILALNREQLFDGKDSQGQDLSPGYLEDPYFKTKEAAQRYSDWKDKITPNSKRRKGVPNLYINGYFHNSINVKVSDDGLRFTSTVVEGQSIKNKFGGGIYGLDKESRIDLNKTARPSFISKIRGFLKL